MADKNRRDAPEVDSDLSFPASDPPSHNPGVAGAPSKEKLPTSQQSNSGDKVSGKPAK